MDKTKKFLEYAAAFEKTYADDDWKRLEPYFTEGAVYRVTGGAPLGGRWEGRAAVLAQLRDSVHRLDRRFEQRSIQVLGSPRADAQSFEIDWQGTYRKTGCPDLVIAGKERVVFEGDRICSMEDLMEEGVGERVRDYVERYLRD